MYQCVDCGSQNPHHICPKHPTFTVKDPGVVVTPRDPAALAEENAELRKTLERIVAMDAVTDAEREHYWTDRAERMRDLAMMALGGEPVPPLSQLLETARRGLSYIQYGAKDLDDARRAAEHALNWMPGSGEKSDRYRKALQYIAEGGKLNPVEVARNALGEKPKSEWAICGWCAGTGKDYGKECPKCQGAGGKALETEK